MIDWTKPIETVDGRGAKIIARLPNAADAPTMVWIESDRNGFGDVFLVNNEGFRCDDRALFSGRQEPFIRNVRVKRKAWVKLRCIEFGEMADTKAGIESQISERDRDNGWEACYVEWEKEP